MIRDPSSDLYPEERRKEIVDRVNNSGRISVVELARQFGVSEVTIRADLQALAARNLVIRTHGGAVAAVAGIRELSLAFRSQQQVCEKDRIGEAGAGMVAHGDAIILDSSSTGLAIARRLKNHHELTILTNSLVVAHEMLDARGVTVVMPGGTVRRDMASLIGGTGLETFQRFNIQRGFFGAHGLTLAEGLTDVSAEEADVKRTLVAMCRQVVAILDGTKWGRVGLASFARLEAIDAIITDRGAPVDLVDRVQASGVQVVLA